VTASRLAAVARRALLAALAAALLALAPPAPATAAPRPATLAQTRPTNPGADRGSVTIDVTGERRPSQSILIILLLTLLGVAPALLIMLTSFTRVVIVLSITRNALGMQAIPPNQVIVGLALFLSLFIMTPTLSAMNRDGLQPLLAGQKTQKQAYDAAVAPLRRFMLAQTRREELALFVRAAGQQRPASPDDVDMASLVPAFILSELRAAFIIGFVIFIPFLIIDMIVSSTLMSMGMMMLPPVLVSLPFKLLLFVMVDGWALIVRSLITSYR
jgi:flagellar biosynthetic protein FliP